jgi:hypothetical protein
LNAPTDDDRRRRIALNETVFREVNERLNNLAAGRDVAAAPLDLVCECGNIECRERISIDPAEYERLRSDPMQFAVVRGHDEQDVEEVVVRRPAYDVVRKKLPEGQRIARQSDLR